MRWSTVSPYFTNGELEVKSEHGTNHGDWDRCGKYR